MQDEENIDKNSMISMEDTGTEPRVYEVGYLLVPTIPGEEVPMLYGNIKELVTSMGGDMITDEMPRMIPLAYTMSKIVKNVKSKFDNAYFGWVKFTMSPDAILKLKTKLDLDTNIIRFLITKTVKENTIAAKRFVQRDARRRTPVSHKEEGGAPVEIDEKEIDKEIDAMVAV